MRGHVSMAYRDILSVPDVRDFVVEGGYGIKDDRVGTGTTQTGVGGLVALRFLCLFAIDGEGRLVGMRLARV